LIALIGSNTHVVWMLVVAAEGESFETEDSK
jgi:hypothetical protein